MIIYSDKYTKNIIREFEKKTYQKDTDKVKKEIKEFNEQIDYTTQSLISEAVKHFKKRYRSYGKNDFDERYFYKEEEVYMFLKANKNPDVKIKIEYDSLEPNKIYCYIAYR